MAEAFPTTPRAPTVVRLSAIVIGLIGVALATRCTITSTRWVGRTFPGFLLLDNRIIASIGLAHWNGRGDLYQQQVMAVDGHPVSSAVEAYSHVEELPPDTPIHYLLRSPRGVEREVTVRSQRFELFDWVFLFGAYLINSAVYLASGLVVWVLRPRAPLGLALLAFGTTGALWMLTAQDLYGPADFFRLHVVGEAFFPAATAHLALFFPGTHSLARFAWVGYALSLALLVPYQILLYQPGPYVLIHNLCMLYLGIVGGLFGVRIVHEYLVGRSQLVRQRIRMVTLGTLVGFAVPGVIFLASALSGGGVAVNTAGFTGFLFAIAVAYAVVKHDLFEIDAMVKRGAYYILLTGAIGAAYAMSIVLFNWALPGAITHSRRISLALHAGSHRAVQPAAHVPPGCRRSRLLPHQLRRRQGARGGRWRAGLGAHSRSGRASGARRRRGRDSQRAHAALRGQREREPRRGGRRLHGAEDRVPLPDARARAHRVRPDGSVPRRGDRRAGP